MIYIGKHAIGIVGLISTLKVEQNVKSIIEISHISFFRLIAMSTLLLIFALIHHPLLQLSVQERQKKNGPIDIINYLHYLASHPGPVCR